uniref:Protein kinase domain-containing protein n=1 Tax=Plectus sambesii TaxID=2011161 RepID=A0A914WL69_9BILA
MEAIRYFTQAAEGLVYLHGQKPKPIIHRNIKCKNLLLTTQYNVKLADFGLATYLAQSNSLQIYLSNTPSSIAGTYRFTAPEIIINQMTPEAYCRESDVWSLACTLVEMISGHPPYKERLRNGTEKQQSKGMQKDKTTLGLCITVDEVCLSLIERLRNGTGKQQNKGTPKDKIILESCMQVGEVCCNLMKRLQSGTEKQQNKVMLEDN